MTTSELGIKRKRADDSKRQMIRKSSRKHQHITQICARRTATNLGDDGEKHNPLGMIHGRGGELGRAAFDGQRARARPRTGHRSGTQTLLPDEQCNFAKEYLHNWRIRAFV